MATCWSSLRCTTSESPSVTANRMTTVTGSSSSDSHASGFFDVPMASAVSFTPADLPCGMATPIPMPVWPSPSRHMTSLKKPSRSLSFPCSSNRSVRALSISSLVFTSRSSAMSFSSITLEMLNPWVPSAMTFLLPNVFLPRCFTTIQSCETILLFTGRFRVNGRYFQVNGFSISHLMKQN